MQLPRGSTSRTNAPEAHQSSGANLTETCKAVASGVEKEANKLYIDVVVGCSWVETVRTSNMARHRFAILTNFVSEKTGVRLCPDWVSEWFRAGFVGVREQFCFSKN